MHTTVLMHVFSMYLVVCYRSTSNFVDSLAILAGQLATLT